MSQYRFLSVADCIRANGERHLSNADRHRAAGNEAYAVGSEIKAARNYEKAADIDRWFDSP